MKKLLFLLLVVCVPVMAGPTYFCYSKQELCQLKGAPVDHCLSTESLKKWDKVAADAMDDLPFFKRVRIYTYLYVAQSEVANLSCRTKGQMWGSFDPVSDAVLAYFLPDDYSAPRKMESDDFSKEAAEIIMAKVKKRVECEMASTFEYKMTDEQKDEYTMALYTAKWIPWYVRNIRALGPPPPPCMDCPCWKGEVAAIKGLQNPMTDEKEKAIHYWAAMDDKDGNWRVIANDFLWEHSIRLPKVLAVRATLMTGLYDGAIVCFAAKYRYMVIRPKAYDDSVEYIIDPPAHPSYPSGHSTESTIASQILSFYFPRCRDYFQCMANEACCSRLWAGIHYPIDDHAGRQTGKKVARRVLGTR